MPGLRTSGFHRPGRAGRIDLLACLPYSSHLTLDHASLSRRDGQVDQKHVFFLEAGLNQQEPVLFRGISVFSGGGGGRGGPTESARFFLWGGLTNSDLFFFPVFLFFRGGGAVGFPPNPTVLFCEGVFQPIKRRLFFQGRGVGFFQHGKAFLLCRERFG